jgi:bifunctional DNA-binding transcriptional regulator/antitoxin component of YhaV-PrlF toxin-antitoxin module
MSLIRSFVRVDAQGKIALPANIQREAALKKGQLVELKVVGGGKPKNIVITARENTR